MNYTTRHMMQNTREGTKRAVVASVQLPGVSDLEFEASLSELRQLAKTLGFEVVGTFTQKRSSFDSVAYLGAGKRQEMRRFVRNEPEPDAAPELPLLADDELAEEDLADLLDDEPDPSEEDTGHWRATLLLVDHEISPTQARNLEKELGVEVMDRTMVILEIFHRHARSRAARAQVEIVRLGYMAPRLREAAKLAGPQGRQRSGVGGRGAGEAKGELDRRKIRDRIAELQEELKIIDVERKTQRARRQEGPGRARAAFVGYTNAGKSTLVRALTGSDVLVADKLFATLDTTVRALHPDAVPRVLVSDTVGFIKNLPHGLVASFKSTLEEALEASLLIHVVDASDPAFERQLAVTEKVLEEIGADEVPRQLVFNKIDRVVGDEGPEPFEQRLREQYPGCLVMSARREGDVQGLRETILAFFRRNLVEGEFFLPWSAQNMRGEIFLNCEVLEDRPEPDGTFMRVRAEPEVVERLRKRFASVAGEPVADE